jgi:ribosomal protein S12 methylthiotransferase accessory factor
MTATLSTGRPVPDHLQNLLARPLTPGWPDAPSTLNVRLGFLGLQNALDPEVAAERISSMDDGEPVLPVYAYARVLVVAPPVLPGVRAGACFHCLERRWQQLRFEEERDALERGSGVVAASENPYLDVVTAGIVHNILAAIVRSDDTGWPRSASGLPYVYEIRLDSFQVRRFPLSQDGDCPRCRVKTFDDVSNAQLALQSRPKPSPGALRLRDVHSYGLEAETYANPICGILGTTAGHAFDSTTTTPVTGYTRIRGDHSLHEFFWSGHADNYDDSKLLGILEGLERHAGLTPRQIVPSVVSSYADLDDYALDPRDVGLYPDVFYEHIGPRFTPFSDDLVIPWVWAYSLRDRKPILVPQLFVYYLIVDHRSNFLQECSNGCATGSCLEEATLYGLLELIERDAFLLGWYGRAPLPEIDTSTIRSRATRMMIDRLSLMGYDVRLFDNRIDFSVPVVSAVAVRRDGGLGTLCFAAGASFDPEDAVRAALCEIASYVPSFAQRTEDSLDLVREMQEDYKQVTELRHHAILFGVPEMAHHADFLLDRDPRDARSMDDLYGEYLAGRKQHADLRDDVEELVTEITDAGFDVIVTDQTSPEEKAVGLSTVATIVPGLVPIDFGWTMQRVLSMPRLRTAFQRAGWRTDPLRDDEINMVPHPFP